MYQDKTSLLRHPMRNDILIEARSWVGTPYQHQAMVKGIGVDCVGFIVGVGLATGALTITRQQIKAYSGYGRLPDPETMGKVIRRHLDPVNPLDVGIGDIAWIAWRLGQPMHLALIGEHKGSRTLIHALGDIGKVVEHTLNPMWDDRIVSFWRYPRLV